MRIGIDVESGEQPFGDLIRGAIRSCDILSNISIFLIGNVNNVKRNFPNIDSNSNIYLVQAKEIIGMNEPPIDAVRRKKDSTVTVGMHMIKDNSIDVFFSPGNTGATVAAAVLMLGKFHGIKKPALTAFFPRSGEGETLILDIGANPDSNEENLYHNALLGQYLYKIIYDKKNPTVGLLNIGTEAWKGRYSIKKTYGFLKNINGFVGNVEGYNILNGTVDVVVCDGFTGNSILKISEALKELFIVKTKDYFYQKIKEKSISSLLFKLISKNLFSKNKKNSLSQYILPQFYGGAPLLGVNGTVIIGHGMCSEDDLINAIVLSEVLYRKKFLSKLKLLIKNKKK